MTDHIEIRTGVFVPVDTATPLDFKSAAILAGQRFANRSRMPSRASRPHRTVPTRDGVPIDHIDQAARTMFGKPAAELAKPQLRVLVEHYQRQARRHLALADTFTGAAPAAADADADADVVPIRGDR